MLPLYLLTNSKDQQLIIELKTHEKITGTLNNVDSWMNITLKQAKLTQFNETLELPELYIRGRFIKCITLQENVIDTIKQNNNNGNNNNINNYSNSGGYNNNRDRFNRRSHINNNNSNNRGMRRSYYNNSNGSYNQQHHHHNGYLNNNSNNNNNTNNNNNNRQSRVYYYDNNNNNNGSNNNNTRSGLGGYVQFHQPRDVIESSTNGNSQL
ncbi:U6 snRNA complex subunit LSM4 SCDLUD_000154 [Saccharomycodes ludwigii]|uniref:U6 snRNA complex subunit LSM4 n=1 Tax=Saccharomycodes ludwigii TaxID=36035 RepID=UPI001E87CB0E|nr:hypothetical protein SCDLUD_000154 [Saccharomycodes ludwigii]KAH3902574.1 hypothetical protein SCDLUD_000154 [Saccharomycodes ludwigii]